MKADREILKRIIKGTKLIASINTGNAVLAYKENPSSQLKGITVDIVERLAQDLKVEFELHEKDIASKSVAAVTEKEVDLGFFAIDPARSDSIIYTPPYLLIEGCYLVELGSPIIRTDQVDSPGHRIVVGRGSAYDLHLTRTILQAEIVRVERSQDVVEYFLKENCDVAAGVRQQLEVDCQRNQNLKILHDPFMTICQAVAIHADCGTDVLQALSNYIEQLKTENYISKSAKKHAIEGITITIEGAEYPSLGIPKGK